MLTRIFLLLLGFGLMVAGCTYLVIYLNLLALGYTIGEYVSYILHRMECYFVILGFLILTYAIFGKGGINRDLHL